MVLTGANIPKGVALADLAQLAQFASKPAGADRPAISTRIDAIDKCLPHKGLALGVIHEWIGLCGDDGLSSKAETYWTPPLSLLLQVAGAATSLGDSAGSIWIGHRVWPYVPSLFQTHGVPGLDRSVFVRAGSVVDRLWACDLALRSGVAAVVVDGSGFNLIATRRLQLAAEAGAALCLLARPPWERFELSAAATRWLVSNRASSSMMRRWTVELLRCKGMQPAAHATRVWVLERDRATRRLRVAIDILDRPREETAGEDIRQVG